mmetsp:Transcript_21129/g.66312  ORF Transcript_21129/g.66312 Transcript_21129/m.66312 type:complete len:235 (+) Transcript_21129:487-1191(+)
MHSKHLRGCAIHHARRRRWRRPQRQRRRHVVSAVGPRPLLLDARHPHSPRPRRQRLECVTVLVAQLAQVLPLPKRQRPLVGHAAQQPIAPPVIGRAHEAFQLRLPRHGSRQGELQLDAHAHMHRLPPDLPKANRRSRTPRSRNLSVCCHACRLTGTARRTRLRPPPRRLRPAKAGFTHRRLGSTRVAAAAAVAHRRAQHHLARARPRPRQGRMHAWQVAGSGHSPFGRGGPLLL